VPLRPQLTQQSSPIATAQLAHLAKTKSPFGQSSFETAPAQRPAARNIVSAHVRET
jgi:hypothetical protein